MYNTVSRACDGSCDEHCEDDGCSSHETCDLGQCVDGYGIDASGNREVGTCIGE